MHIIEGRRFRKGIFPIHHRKKKNNNNKRKAHCHTLI